MQLTSTLLDFTKVASTLSLSVANYKPIPVLQTNDSSGHGRVGAVSSHKSGTEDHSAASWGLPSILHVPESSSKGNNGRVASSHKGSSGETVGAGCNVLDEYSPKDSLNVEFPPYNQTRANIMRYRKQIGVNGGSWFVLENWMAPSMFDCAVDGKASEMDFLNGYGGSEKGMKSAQARLEEHWDTWIQAKDFVEMKSLGLNTLRLPIGYWHLPGSNFTKNSDFEPYGKVYVNAWKYIKRAIKYADDNDIGVLIDMHGAYGSQNGQPHSGVNNGKADFFNDFNENKMTKLLVWLVQELEDVSNVIGIELLNEPHNTKRLWKWYSRTMDAMRKAQTKSRDMPLYFHDAFSPSQGAEFVSKRDDFVVQDTHSYFVYTQQDRDMSASKHTSHIEGQVQKSMSDLADKARGNMVVGEWSCALNPNSLRNSNNKRAATSDYCRAQTSTYLNATAGVMFWSWNMEHCSSNAGWCFKSVLPRYMKNSYNAWGLDGQITNKTINTVTEKIISQELPSKYRSDTKGKSLSVCNKDGGANQSSGSTKNSGRNAAVKKSQSHASKHDGSSKKNKHTLQHRSESHEGALNRRGFHHHVLSDILGYGDGFNTAKFLAGLMSLSRLGFEQQYLSDTGEYYKKHKIIDIGKHDSKSYKSHFKKGLNAMENKIIKIAEKA